MKRLEDIAKLLANKINEENHILYYLKVVHNEALQNAKAKVTYHLNGHEVIGKKVLVFGRGVTVEVYKGELL